MVNVVRVVVGDWGRCEEGVAPSLRTMVKSSRVMRFPVAIGAVLFIDVWYVGFLLSHCILC